MHIVVFSLGFSFFKFLFIPAYHSTDFEVHRNWLALTHSLPVSKWYHENTSEWTLDYPPFFAYFELALSQGADAFDSDMLKVDNLNYDTYYTVFYQRLTVILTDWVYIYAVYTFIRDCLGLKAGHVKGVVLGLLLIANYGLFLVDHMHFQYNGFLFGVMLLSITSMYQERYIRAALYFAFLLNLKHIYLYIAPPYFIYLLRNYCFVRLPPSNRGQPKWQFSVTRFCGLGVTVISVFALSLGPFVYMGQLGQVLSRLFPFKRGLCHAYWAPNFWALYNVADKALAVTGVRTGVLRAADLSAASMTGGLVQEFSHQVLPSVPPLVTLVATALAMLPSLWRLWRDGERPEDFVRAITQCAFASFMFGWHVHEKAILLVLLPLCMLVASSRSAARDYLLLSTVGHFSLFPLVFTPREQVIKVLLYLVYTIFAFSALPSVHRKPETGRSKGRTLSRLHLPLLSTLESIYLVGLVPLYLYTDVGHWVLGPGTRLPFLPLLMTSCYCALGLSIVWLRWCWGALTGSATDSSRLKTE